METVIFQLQAPLSSWGDTAVGEYRPSAEYPSRSALQGLLGAALGIKRDDHAAQTALAGGSRLAVAVLAQGRLLRDYHTVQVPGRADLKKRPHATRRDELAIPKQDLNTILSSRDYRQDASSLVAVQALPGAIYSLDALAAALRRPKFVLYLGRKSCPLAAPLHPVLVDEASIEAAFAAYRRQLAALWTQALPGKPAPDSPAVKKIVWGDDFGPDDLAVIGRLRDLSVVRKDQVITRRGWRFADRMEHIALCEKE